MLCAEEETPPDFAHGLPLSTHTNIILNYKTPA